MEQDTKNLLNTDLKIIPFLRWAGAKRWLLKNGIQKFIPKSFKNYYEPFLGSGAVYFHLMPENTSYLSDLNTDLIQTYLQIKNNLDEILTYFKYLRNTKEDYDRIKKKVFELPTKRAAQFIYLNRTSFNGIYRVNSRGVYNVPYGFRKNIKPIDKENLKAIQNLLKKASIKSCDFEKAVTNAQEGDFVFLDPPYTVTHSNNGFIEYNQKIFSWEDQKRLANITRLLDKKGVYFTLTNAAHKSIDELYKNCGRKTEVKRMSTVGGKFASRGVISEYIYTNID